MQYLIFNSKHLALPGMTLAASSSSSDFIVNI